MTYDSKVSRGFKKKISRGLPRKSRQPAKPAKPKVKINTCNCSTIFGQVDANTICQNRGIMDEQSQKAGHKVRCRDPRCSVDCYLNAMQKEAWCLSELIEQTDSSQYRWHRMCLKLPRGSNVDAHKVARAKFNKYININSKKRSIKCKHRSYQHITAIEECHYDGMIYVQRTTIEAVSDKLYQDAAAHAGFEITIKPLRRTDENDEIMAFAKYDTKTRHEDKNAFHYIPVKKNGLSHVWGSSGFWRTSQAKIWACWIKRNMPGITLRLTGDALQAMATQAPITIRTRIAFPRTNSVKTSAQPIRPIPTKSLKLSQFMAQWQLKFDNISKVNLSSRHIPLANYLAKKYPDYVKLSDTPKVSDDDIVHLIMALSARARTIPQLMKQLSRTEDYIEALLEELYEVFVTPSGRYSIKRQRKAA